MGSEQVDGDRGQLGEVDELLEGCGISLGDLSLIERVLEAESERVLSVVLPYSLEMGLLGYLFHVIVRVDDLIFVNQFRGNSCNSFPLLFEGLSALFGGGIHAEDELSVLVGVGEREHLSVDVIEMTFVSVPGGLWYLVVEKLARHAVAVVFKSEPVDQVRVLSLSSELHRSPLGSKVVHGVVPGLSGSPVVVISASVLSLSPVRNSVALEKNLGSSVGGALSDSLLVAVGVEVLGEKMHLDVGLLPELVVVLIHNSESTVSGLLHVELVGHLSEVGHGDSPCLGKVQLEGVPGVENELHESGSRGIPEVEFVGSSQLALAQSHFVDELVEE